MDPDSRPSPDVLIEDKTWRRLIPNVDALVRRAATRGGPGAATVLLTSDSAIRRLNRTYRGKDKPTNVLTFDSGDIAIALGTVRREAAAASRPVAHHLQHLVVHAVLHLAGEDHATAGEARRMEQEETRILHGLGVPNPWKPRA